MNRAKRLMALLLAVVITISVMAGCGNKVQEPPVNPEISMDPAVTEPDITQPDLTDPIVTEPDITQPEVTDSTVSEPEVTEPSVTEPSKTTEPSVTTDKNDFSVEDMSAVMYATDSVNVRSGPSADFSKIGRFDKNQAVTVTGRASTGWFRVDYEGSTGYVSNAYLTDKKPSETVTTTTTAGDDGDVIIDDDNGDVVIDDDNQGSNHGTSTTLSNAVKDNGWSYMMAHMYDERYVTVLNQIFEGMKNFQTTIQVDPLLTADETMAFANVIRPNMAVEYCYVSDVTARANSSGMLSEVVVEYYVNTPEEGLAMVESLRKKADSVISKLKSSWSDYQKIKYIHDWLVLNSTPDENNVGGPWAPTAYGAIVDGRPTCLGYGKAMLYLLDRAGYDCAFVVGKGHNARHLWVKVKVGSSWYCIDPTWDDPYDITKIDPNYVEYDYFMVPDSFMARTHAEVYDTAFYSVPAATSEKYCWHNVEKCYANSYDEAVKILKSATEDAVNNGGKYEYIRIKFPSEELYLKVKNAFTTAKFGSDILAPISSKYKASTRYLGSTKWTLTYVITK